MVTYENLQDPDLLFDPQWHSYSWRGQRLTSVTKLVAAYSHPFDADFHAARVAKREKKTTEQVLREWRTKGTAAANLGTEVHSTAERISHCISTNGCWSYREESENSKLAGCKRALYKAFENHGELAYGWCIPEVRVCYPKYSLAGTIDSVCSWNGVSSIVDWKTSSDLPLFGYRNMLPPLERLRDTNFWAYCLQLNLYARILRDRYGYDAEEMILVWLKPSGTYEEVRVPYLGWAIKKILEDRLG